MSVHIGELTSEVVTAAAPPEPAENASVWEQRRRLEATLQRLRRDRARTATEPGDD